jgi:hypothetical protein
MCSMNGGQLGRICRAIDELAGRSASSDHAASGGPAPAAGDDGAAQAGAARRTGAADQADPTHQTGAADQAGAPCPAGRDDGDIARLAAIWEMVADADPELAKRLPGYLSAAE